MQVRVETVTPEDKPIVFHISTLEEALSGYDRDVSISNQQFKDIKTQEDFLKWDSDHLTILSKVQEAYWFVTQDRNSRDHCRLVSINDARALVKYVREKEQKQLAI